MKMVHILVVILTALLFFSVSINVYSIIKIVDQNNQQHCLSAQKILWGNTEEAYLIFCTKGIYLGKEITDSMSDYQLIESDQSFPDFFSYNNTSVILTAETFPGTNPQFVAIVGHFDSGFIYKKSLGIYKITDSGVTRAFKKGFDDVKGRWTGFEFSDTAPKITIISKNSASECENCINETKEYYAWDKASQIFLKTP